MESRNARLGLTLFVIYTILYTVFVLLNAFSPETMEAMPIFGINLAVLSGFGLIITAVVVALIYGWFCQSEEENVADKEDQG